MNHPAQGRDDCARGQGSACNDVRVRTVPLGERIVDQRSGRLPKALDPRVPGHTDDPVEGRLGVIAVMRDDHDAAAEWNARLEAYDTDYVGGRPTLWRAKMAVAGGDREQAITLLRQAFNQGVSFWSITHADAIHVQVELTPLFDDPAYRELVAPRE